MSREWSVRVAVNTVNPHTDDQVEPLMEALDGFSPAVGTDNDGRLGFQLAVTAVDIFSAMLIATHEVGKALLRVELKVDNASIEAMTWDEFNRQLDIE